MIVYFGEKCTFEEMVIDLRQNRNVDPDDDLSDEFLIQEAYNLGEWEYEDDI
jgi:hypothetical protein